MRPHSLAEEILRAEAVAEDYFWGGSVLRKL